jgi:hypothetical protein
VFHPPIRALRSRAVRLAGRLFLVVTLSRLIQDVFVLFLVFLLEKEVFVLFWVGRPSLIRA